MSDLADRSASVQEAEVVVSVLLDNADGLRERRFYSAATVSGALTLLLMDEQIDSAYRLDLQHPAAYEALQTRIDQCKGHKHSPTLGASVCPRCKRFIPDAELEDAPVDPAGNATSSPSSGDDHV